MGEESRRDAEAAGELARMSASELDAAADELPGTLAAALDTMGSATAELAYHGTNAASGHASGTPTARGFVGAGDDERDASLRATVLGEELAWSGRLFDVSRVELRLPNARSTRHDIVRHPGAVAIVALTDEGRICLVRQYRTALDRVTVEIPAGKLNPGEDPLDCARRELREETGMVAAHMAFLTTIASSVGFCDELIHLYMATGLTFDASSPDADEFINVDLVDLHELVDAVLDGRVEDGKTVVGALVCDAVARRLAPAEPVDSGQGA